MFAMSGDGTDDVIIPVVFLFSQDAWQLLQALAKDPSMIITLSGNAAGNIFIHFAMLGLLQCFLTFHLIIVLVIRKYHPPKKPISMFP